VTPQRRTGPILLVSVRSAAEARQALEGGAGLIDVKEPSRGSLGRSDDATIAAVMRHVRGRCPVSAAFGELLDGQPPAPLAGLAYAKCGLARCGPLKDWQRRLDEAGDGVRGAIPHCRPVAVAYADWRRAEAPRPHDVLTFARQRRWQALLIDTWLKDGTSLLDWLPLPGIISLCAQCREADIPIALAGSLGLEQITTLAAAAPSWFAVRGAVCAAGCRTAAIDPQRVRRLVTHLHAACGLAPGAEKKAADVITHHSSPPL
jgi:uncharacterized protein (UPF0264 family)